MATPSHPASPPVLRLDQLPTAALVADASGRLQALNQAAADLLGLDREEALTRSIDSPLAVLGEDGQPLPAEAWPMVRTLATGSPCRTILGIRHREGDLRWLDVSTAPLPDGGVLALCSDCTRQHGLQRLLEARTRIAEVAQGGSLEDVLRKTLDEAEDFTGSTIGFYHFVEPDQVTLSLQAWSTRTAQEYCKAEGKGRHYPIDQAGVWADAVRQGQAVIHNDYESMAHKRGLPEGHAALLREAVVTVRREGRVLAILGVGNKPGPYTQQDIDQLQELAELAWGIAEQKRSEEWLHLRNLALEQSLNAFVLMDAEGRMRHVNQAFLRFWGYHHAREVLGRPRTEFWVDPEAAREIADEAMESGAAVAELLARRADGSTFLAEAHLSVVRGGPEQVLAMLGTATDITEQRRVQLQIQEQKEALERFFQASVDLLCLADISGRFLRVNQAWGRLLGYEIKDLEGQSFLDLIHPEDLAPTREAMAVLAQDQPVLDFVNRYRAKDGSWHSLEWRAVAKGGVISAGARDITERLEVDRRLRESSERLAQLSVAITQSPVAVVITDPQGIIEYVNPAFERISGYRAEEVLGQTPSLLKSGMHDAAFYQALWEQLRRGETWEGRFHNRRKDGTLIWEQALISPVRNEAGYITGYLALKEDITEAVRLTEERRRLEAQLLQAQRLESLGSLAGGVAHDMNNVLMAIMGLATALRAGEDASSVRGRSMDTIISACQKGGRMVRSLLDFARKGTEDRRILDLNALLQEEVALLERTTFQQVKVITDLAPDLPGILGDSAALAHTVMNLCVNAVDAMEGGGTLTLRTRLDEAGWVVCQVEDTGCGMPPEVMARALEPYFTTKPEGKGTGLGLAMAYGTLQAHGGTLSLASTPGRGTTVSLRLPPAEPLQEAAEVPALSEEGRTGLRILVVDDDELVRTSTESLLELLNVTAESVPSGEEALERLTQEPGFDLVILDMNMPGLGGAGTLPRLRARHPELPVLLATGRVDRSAEILAEAHGHVRLLPKPYSLDDLERALAGKG